MKRSHSRRFKLLEVFFQDIKPLSSNQRFQLKVQTHKAHLESLKLHSNSRIFSQHKLRIHYANSTLLPTLKDTHLIYNI